MKSFSCYRFIVWVGCLCLVLLAFSQCASPERKIRIANHTDYRLRKHPEMLQHTTVLRTDGVYVDRAVLTDGTPCYWYLRFFENGRCYESDTLHGEPSPDSLSVTSAARGQRTFFLLRGEGITYEHWNPALHYYIQFMDIDTNILTNLNGYKGSDFAGRPVGLDNHFVMHFVPLPFTKLNADW